MAGDGSLELINQADGERLDAAFSVDGSGQLQLDLSGQFLQSLGPNGASTSSSSQPIDHTFWYVSRAAGLTAYLLLFFNVCLGLGISTSLFDTLLSRWRVLDLHEFTGLLALGFVVLHMFVLLGDHYTGFTLVQVLMPFTSSYRPLWTTVGVFAFYLSVVVIVSFYGRQRIGHRVWRVLHYVSYAVYLLAFAHSVLAGTDTREPWAALLYWVTGAIVVVLTLRRLSASEVKRLPQTADGSPK